MRHRLSILAALLGLGIALSPAIAEDAVELPVTGIALFSSGVGYFQHDGSVTGDARMALAFSTRGISDIIKSLILRDLDGGSVRSVSYASHDPIDRTLKAFSIDLTGNPGLAAILSQARGKPVTLSVQSLVPALSQRLAGPETASAPAPVEQVGGTVVGVESRVHPLYGETSVLNLLASTGLRSIPLPDILEVRFTDPATQADFQKALALLSTSRDIDRKQVEVHFAGSGKRRVRVGYLQETPVWKTTYRLALADSGDHFLQGWAVVENATDTDWSNVSLTLVSGRPITFFMDLYTPLYTTRPEVRMPLYESLAPQTYDMALGDAMPAEEAAGAAYSSMAPAPSSKSAAAPSRAAVAAASPPPPPVLQAGGGVTSAASGEQVGALFQYAIEKPVTLARQQSALLPIVNQSITGQRYSIYNPDVDAVHPLNAVKLKNTSSLHLMQGPITVFDGSSYAGDAQITDMSAGAEQFISYALDLEVEVDPTIPSVPDDLVTVRIFRGTLVSTWRQVRQATYAVVNRSQKPRTVIIEQAQSSGWNLVQPKQPMEETRGLYRFAVPVEKGKTVSCTVIEDRTVDQTVAFTNLGSDRIDVFVKSKNVSQAVKDAINRLVTLKQKLADATAARSAIEQQMQSIFNDQTRIRANMERLDKSADLYKKYVQSLSDQEDTLAKLDDNLDKAKADETARRKDVDTFVANIDVK